MLHKEILKHNYKNHVILYTLQYLHPTTGLLDPNFHLQVLQDLLDETEPAKVAQAHEMGRGLKQYIHKLLNVSMH